MIAALQSALAADDGAPLRVQLVVTVAMLNEAGKPSTPADIADCLGLDRGKVKGALHRLRKSMSTLVSVRGQYRLVIGQPVQIDEPSVRGSTPTVREMTPLVREIAPEPDAEQVGARNDTVGVNPRTGTPRATHARSISEPSSKEEGGIAREARSSNGACPAPLPSLSDFGSGDGLKDAILAWEQLPRRRGLDGRPQSTWILSARPDDVRALRGLVEGYGAALVLRALSDLGERSHTWRNPPRMHYVAERCERLDQERAVAQAKADEAGDWPPGMDRSYVENAGYDEHRAAVAFCEIYYQEPDVIAWMTARRQDPAFARLLIYSDIPPAVRADCERTLRGNQ